MTETSQNGWSVIDDYGDPLLSPNPTVPGTTVQLLGGTRAGDVTTVLGEVGRRWNATVEPLIAGHCWGYQKRHIRGSSTVSNHASGTAADFNGPEHPIGTSPASTMSAAQIVAVGRIRDAMAGVVRFGMFYTGRKDVMHAEINVPPGDTRLTALAAAIRAGSTHPNAGDEDMPLNDDDLEKITKIVHSQVQTLLLNTNILDTSYTIPVALKELLISIGKAKVTKK